MKLIEKTELDIIYENIPLIDLKAQRAKIANEINTAIEKVMSHGRFVMGPEVFELEDKLSDYCGAKHAISCSSGSDAILLALMHLNLKEGDCVLVPSFTFISPPQMVAFAGAVPYFVDVQEDSFNIDPTKLEETIKYIKKESKYNIKAVISVDLFGQIADYKELSDICKKYDIILISDAAQSFGSTENNKHAIFYADIMTTSFFPAKPLGCYGEGGAIFVNNTEISDSLKSKRNHGMRNHKYNSEELGINGRLTTLQAAILLEKFRIFSGELELREKIANRYGDNIHGSIKTPSLKNNTVSSWAQYTLRSAKRDELKDYLEKFNIPSAIYYPIPSHKQNAYTSYPTSHCGLEVTNMLADEVISIPMHPYLENHIQDYIISVINKF